MRWPFMRRSCQLVPRRELSTAAIALNGIAMNTSRIVGPVIAGALIASLGTGYVFLLNAALSLAAGFVIMRWRLEPKASAWRAVFRAMRVGFQYVSQSPVIRAVLLRIAIFFLQSTALLALLPLVAKRMPDGGAWVYTWLLASLGFGAIATAVFLPRLRVLISRDRLLRDGTLLCVRNGGSRLRTHCLERDAGDDAGRRHAVSGGQYADGGTQLSLPDWVRARGMSIYMMTMMAAAVSPAPRCGGRSRARLECRGRLWRRRQPELLWLSIGRVARAHG